jgi:hypothetical protein
VQTFALSARRARELGTGELEGAGGAIAPVVRRGEDEATMRARLVCRLAFSFGCDALDCLRFGFFGGWGGERRGGGRMGKWVLVRDLLSCRHAFPSPVGFGIHA